MHSLPSGQEIVIKTVLTLGKYLFNEIHHPWDYVSLCVQRVGRAMWVSDLVLSRCEGKGVRFGAGARDRTRVKVRIRIKTRVKTRVGARARVRVRILARARR